MSNGTITIKPTRDFIASCNVCLARNFDTENFPAIGRRVDTLFHVSIRSGDSGFSFHLCKDCLQRLVTAAAVALIEEERRGEEIV